jgi:hypothetical protein
MKMDNKKIMNLFKLLIVVVIFGMGQGVLAAYQLHEKIPGQENITTLQGYLEGLYKFGIAIVAILAVVMVAVGAFMYIVSSAGNVAKMANAKEIITNALVGLVMALLAWLILFVINPDLIGSGLNMQGPEYNNRIGDGRPDPAVCTQNNNPYYESIPCNGDKVCINDQCVYKKDFCPLDEGWSGQNNGGCHTADLAQPGQPCGPMKSGGEGLVGFCSTERTDCPAGGYRITNGKQCANSVCCVVNGL